MPPADLSVHAAVRRDLDKIAKTDAALAESGLAASALQLAKLLDDPKNSATSKAACAGELRDVLDRIRELAPPEEEADQVDELGKKRAARRKAS